MAVLPSRRGLELIDFEHGGMRFTAGVGHFPDGRERAAGPIGAVLDMLDRNPTRSMADLYRALPQTWGSPTMSAECPDEEKYAVANRVRGRFEKLRSAKEQVAGHAIVDLVTVNGIRVVTDDGTWGLVRASSNKPELVVVVESPVSEARMRAMFAVIDGVLRSEPSVGAYNQTIQ